MDLVSLKFIGAGLLSLGMVGAALGVGNIFAALLAAIARNPASAPQMQRFAFIGAALAEAMGLFAFVLAMIVILL